MERTVEMSKRKLKPIPITLVDIGVKPDNLYYDDKYSDYMDNDDRHTKWKKQRKLRGFDDRETWDLFTVISHFVYPRLVRFKECNDGYPGTMTYEQWNEILDKMILAFKNIIVYNSAFECTDEINAEIAEGLELFAKNFRRLWY